MPQTTITKLSPPASKSIFTSKTAIINVLIAAGTAYPPVGQWVKDNPQLALYAITAFNVIIRHFTHEKVSLFGSDGS